MYLPGTPGQIHRGRYIPGTPAPAWCPKFSLRVLGGFRRTHLIPIPILGPCRGDRIWALLVRCLPRPLLLSPVAHLPSFTSLHRFPRPRRLRVTLALHPCRQLYVHLALHPCRRSRVHPCRRPSRYGRRVSQRVGWKWVGGWVGGWVPADLPPTHPPSSTIREVGPVSG